MTRRLSTLLNGSPSILAGDLNQDSISTSLLIYALANLGCPLATDFYWPDKASIINVLMTNLPLAQVVYLGQKTSHTLNLV